MWKFNLDWELQPKEGQSQAEARVEAIKNIDLSNLTKKELSSIETYILCGRDLDGTSPVDRKEVYIDTKFSTYNKNKTVSLDEMMENPAFDESVLQKNPVRYKKPKPKIDREDKKIQKIEGMRELWEIIDKQQDIYDRNRGKKPMEPDTRVLTPKELYYMGHYIKELRDQQYYLLDGERQYITIQNRSPHYIEEEYRSQLQYPVLPLGTIAFAGETKFMDPRKDRTSNKHIYTEEEIEKMDKEGKLYFNFLNPEHIYQLVLSYKEIRELAQDTLGSPLNSLLDTLDFYIDKANLNEQEKLILRDKTYRLQNRDIAQNLKLELGISHQENYISTIWNKVVRQIAEAAELHYDEYLCRNYDKAWKKCSRCGRELLRDSRNFVKKAKSVDGLTGRCKMCDKEMRNKKK